MRKQQTRTIEWLYVAAAFIAFIGFAILVIGQAKAEAADPRYPWLEQSAAPKTIKAKHHRKSVRRDVAVDASGNAVVRSKSGIAIRVAPSARAALQCVVDHVEGAGVKIKFMRGYGRGTVRASLHPSGRAIDINQTARNVTHPNVPRAVANAAADQCGVISGARWGYADNGHWNLAMHGRSTQEPWPRVVTK